MKLEEIVGYCLTYPSSYENHPFGEGWTAIRHKGNKKLFALIFIKDEHLCINLKCNPDRSDFLRNAYIEVKPGYHMNKEHWNTIILDGELPEDALHDMVKHSFELTKPKQEKKSAN